MSRYTTDDLTLDWYTPDDIALDGSAVGYKIRGVKTIVRGQLKHDGLPHLVAIQSLTRTRGDTEADPALMHDLRQRFVTAGNNELNGK
jgi:hypothetical protein